MHMCFLKFHSLQCKTSDYNTIYKLTAVYIYVICIICLIFMSTGNLVIKLFNCCYKSRLYILNETSWSHLVAASVKQLLVECSFYNKFITFVLKNLFLFIWTVWLAIINILCKTIKTNINDLKFFFGGWGVKYPFFAAKILTIVKI